MRIVVYRQLEKDVGKTRVPRLIVGDHGSDLEAGVERFCQEHSETCFIYSTAEHRMSLLHIADRNKNGINRGQPFDLFSPCYRHSGNVFDTMQLQGAPREIRRIAP